MEGFVLFPVVERKAASDPSYSSFVLAAGKTYRDAKTGRRVKSAQRSDAPSKASSFGLGLTLQTARVTNDKPNLVTFPSHVGAVVWPLLHLSWQCYSHVSISVGVRSCATSGGLHLFVCVLFVASPQRL